MDRGYVEGGFGDQYDPTEYNMGAAASARMHTVLDSSGTRNNKKKKRKKKTLLKVNASISSHN